MFSETMSAFTEVAEMKTKNSEKRAIFSIKCSRGALSIFEIKINCEKRALFSIKCSRGALSIVEKMENWKNTKRKKNYFRR